MPHALVTSEERVAFRPESRLASDIHDHILDLMEGKARTKRALEDAAAEIALVIERETGFSVKMYFEAFGDVNALFSFELGNTPIDDVIDDMLRTQGQEYRKSRLPSELFVEIQESLDLDTGRLTNPKFSKCFNGAIYVALEFFDNERYTAKEITAIILHEIGHMVTYAERIGDVFHKSAMAHDALDDMFRNPKSRKVLAKDAVALTRKIVKEKKGRTAKDLEKVLEKYDRDYSDMERPRNPFVMLASFLILIPLLIFLSTAIVGYVINLVFRATFGIFGSLTDVRTDRLADSLGGTSRVKYDERWADEYVSLHGYGLYLQTGLQKLAQDSDFAMQKSTRILVSLFVSVAVSERFADGRYNPFALPYDEMNVRTQHIVQSAQAALRTKGISPRAKADLVAQIRLLRKNQAAFQKKYDQEKRMRQILSWIHEFAQRRIPLTFSGSEKKKLMDDYERLRDQSGGLLKNPFGYHAARIDILRKGAART